MTSVGIQGGLDMQLKNLILIAWVESIILMLGVAIMDMPLKFKLLCAAQFIVIGIWVAMLWGKKAPTKNI